MSGEAAAPVEVPVEDAALDVTPNAYDPAQDVSRLLTKIGILTMRLEEVIAQNEVLQHALFEERKKSASTEDSS